MSNITAIFKEFKSEAERQAFIFKQHETISKLSSDNKKLQDEIEHLKYLLTQSVPLIGNTPVEKVILTPEEGLLQSQIQLIQDRSYGQELSLEDVKKLDILLKNTELLKKNKPKTFDGKSDLILDNLKLLEIAKKNGN